MKSGTWRAVLPAEREEEAAMMMDGTNAEENGRRRSATDDVIVASSNAARGEGEIMVLGRGRLLVIESGGRRSLGKNNVHRWSICFSSLKMTVPDFRHLSWRVSE